MKLVNTKTGDEIKIGDTVVDFRGNKLILIGMTPPQKSGSTTTSSASGAAGTGTSSIRISFCP